jgi:signal transduction histidine kinase
VAESLPPGWRLWYNVRMAQREIEPGFLQAFRLFVVTRIVFWVVIGPIMVVVEMAQGVDLGPEQITSMTLIERLTLPNILPILAVEVALLLLLLLPQAGRWLGRWLVPVSLVIAMVPLLIGQYWWPAENPLQTPFIIFFFVMLVLIAWQYSFRYVAVYVLALSLYQARFSWMLGDWPLSVNVGWMVLQAAMMLIVGYTIVQLVSIQREQRAALAEAYDQQAAAHRRLQQYAATLEELTISRERNRLARELHDTLAHSLSAATVQMEAVRSLWAVDPPRARQLLDQADGTIRRGLVEARRALQALRASPLQESGLVPALRALGESAAERCGARLELHLPEQLADDLPPQVEQGIYRIAQEALENVVRHAEAGWIAVWLGQDSHGLVLRVEDDGRGILDDGRGMLDSGIRAAGTSSLPSARRRGDEIPAAAEGDRDTALGLRGMEERAGAIGGHLEIGSEEGRGTRVRLRVPLASTIAPGDRRDPSPSTPPGPTLTGEEPA